MADIYPIEPYLIYTPPKQAEAVILSIRPPIPEMMTYFKDCAATLARTKDLKACMEIAAILDKMRETMLAQSRFNGMVEMRKIAFEQPYRPLLTTDEEKNIVPPCTPEGPI